MGNQPRRRRRRPALVHVSVAVAGILLLTAIYLAAMRLTLEFSQPDGGHPVDTRDAVYLALHTGVVLLSLLLGFVAGRFLSGLGFAYSALFFLCVVVMMAAVQMGSYGLACEGRNDLVRHWTC